MADIRVLRASYRSLASVFARRDEHPDCRMKSLALRIAGELHDCIGDLDPRRIAINFASTTVLDLALTYRAGVADDFLAEIAALTPFSPTAIINAYECSGWGYFLRYASATSELPCLAVCTIVDANLFDLEFWRSSPHWGASGFGVAVLLLELGPAAAADVVVGSARTVNKLAEFALAVRKAGAERKRLPVALPFFPQNVSDMFDRTIPGIDRLPDEHAALGHCFGSDPWILALRRAMAAPGSATSLQLCSIALNGYWAIADVEFASDARLLLEIDR